MFTATTFAAVTALAVVVRIVANPLANVFQKQLTQRGGQPLFIMVATYGLLTLACLLLGPFTPFGPPAFTTLPAPFWPVMISAAVLAVLGNVLLVRALQLGDLSVLGPINAYKAVVGLLISAVLLHEVPSVYGGLGVLLIVAGSYVVLTNSAHARNDAKTAALRSGRAVWLRVAALVFSALDGVLLKKAMLLSSPWQAFFYWCLLGFGLSAGWFALRHGRQLRPQWTVVAGQWRHYVGGAMSVGVTQLASNWALAGMPVGYALALFQLSALLSVGFGYQFFGEGNVVRKLIGAGIMAVGAGAITLFG